MEFLVRHKTIVTLIFFSLFCITSLSVRSTTFTFSIEGVVNALISPFQKGYDAIQDNVSRLWAGFTELNQVREELRKTREQIQKFESLSDELGEIKRENKTLREMLNVKERIQHKSVSAQIISKDPDNWFRTIIIDKGSSDGIKENMPVVAYHNGEKAVVGKVVEVRGSVSRIQPLISSDLKIGVKLQESRLPGLLMGLSANSSLCIMEYVSRAGLIKFGDIVITSGQGGIFPPGLIVGKAIKSSVSESSSYQRVVVQPIIDFNLLEYVFVIKTDPDKDLVDLAEDD